MARGTGPPLAAMSTTAAVRSPVRHIVAGTDGSDSALRAVQAAADLARTFGAQLHLVAAHPLRQFGERVVSAARSDRIDLQRVAEEQLMRTADALGRDGLQIDTRACAGDPAEVLIDVASELDADLIVVASRGMTGIERFLLGSVANKVSHHAPCNVLIVRAR